MEPSARARRLSTTEIPAWYLGFREIIREKIGFVLPQVPAPTLRAFVEGRMRMRRDRTPDDYMALLKRSSVGDAELATLVNTITIRKTHFFRDINQFEAVRDVMKRLAGQRRQKLRIWCAGCSTGEEPYSVAMMADADRVRIELMASDVNTDALATARRGQYTSLTIGEIPDDIRQQYLQRLDRGYTIDPKIERVPQFVPHNLMAPEYLRPVVGLWDIIFCRNVLIYFDEPTVEQVVASFHRVLEPDGLLVLGAGESLHGKKTDYELFPIGRSFAYQPRPVGSHTRPSGRHAAVSLPPALASDEVEIPHGLVYEEPGSQSGVREVVPYDRDEPADLDAFVHDFNRGGDSRRRAIKRLRTILRDRVGTMEELLTLGNALFEDGDPSGALEVYTRAQNLDPLASEVHFLMGLVHKKIGARWPAIQSFRRVLFLDDTHWPAAFYLAGMYASENMQAEAQREYSNTLRILERRSAPPRFVSRLARNEFQSRLAEEVRSVCRTRLRR